MPSPDCPPWRPDITGQPCRKITSDPALLHHHGGHDPATVSGPFGQATLNRRELEHLLTALQPDLIYENEIIHLRRAREQTYR